jgi:hypothetical protein
MRHGRHRRLRRVSRLRDHAIPDLLDELPERERRLFHASVETLANEVARKIDSVESY